jgi:hypothetical protein
MTMAIRREVCWIIIEIQAKLFSAKNFNRLPFNSSPPSGGHFLLSMAEEKTYSD